MDSIETQKSQAISEHYDENIPTVVMLAIFCVPGVVGNALVLIVYSKQLKMTSTQLLIFVIALYDFITALFVVPLLIIYKTYWFSIIDIRFCKLFFGIINFCVLPGPILLFLVTLVRYCHVCKHHWLRFIEPKIITACAFILLCGLFYAVSDIVVVKLEPLYQKKVLLVCTIPNALWTDVTVFSKVIIIFVTGVAIVVLNALIIISNHQQTAVLSKSRKPLMASGSNKKQSQITSGYLNHTSENQNQNTNENLKYGIENQNHNRRDCVKYVKGSKSNQSQNNNLKPGNDGSNKSSILSIKSPSVINSPSSLLSVRTTQEHVDIPLSMNNSITNNEVEISTRNNTGIEEELRRRSDQCSDQCSDHSFKGLSRTTIMISLVCLAYVVSYLPFIVILVYGQRTLVTSSSAEILKFVIHPASSMYYLGSAVNPIIYTFVNPNFRSKCRYLFRSKATKQKQPRHSR